MRQTTFHDRGSILIIVLLMVILVAAFCMSSLVMTHSDSRQADFAVHRAQALYAAQAGLEDTVRQFSNMRACSLLNAPFGWYDGLAGRLLDDGRWLTKDGVSLGQYDVTVNSITAVDTSTRDIAITCVGYVPARGSAATVSRTINAVVRVSVGRSEVFDYVYFINNWGWYFGDTIVANGNVRANGQFDGGGYHATVSSIPRFKGLSNNHFSNWVDDGGVYSGWNVVNASGMQGNVNDLWTQADVTAGKCQQSDVGTNKSQHTYQKQIPMPNLTDLTVYENLAKSVGSYIKVGGTTIVSAVQGDDAGEKQNLYLVGTSAAPIEIHGPVVVRGSVIIQGVVKGQGAIYSGGNVYIPKNLSYLNPPAVPTSHPTQAQMESWLTANGSKDALGLFARKHVVLGDYTNSSWQSYVSSWVNDWRNESKEDAGSDGIPNTKAGRDGILGTADDDVLEGDGVWTTDHYTAMHQAEGLIPSGKAVGDPIPGTGEDIDGDGAFTPRTAMSEFNVPASINSTNWAGNPPSGTSTYASIATSNMTHVDAAIYTNHQVAMLTLASGTDLTFNGCVISRNEDIVYGTSHCIFNYDFRLLDEGNTFGFYLPKVWNPVEVVYWQAQ